MSRELLQQALDALEPIAYEGTDAESHRVRELRAALRAALAQPEPIDGFGGNLDEAFERAPAVRLRAEEIYMIARRSAPPQAGMVYVPEWVVPFARAIEQAHGIGGGGNG